MTLSTSLGTEAVKVALTLVLAEIVTVQGEVEHPPPKKPENVKLGEAVAVRIGVAPEA